MTRIAAVDLLLVDLPPPVPRSDAIQSFVTQETPFVRIECTDGSHGIGYSYTIGTGGSSVMEPKSVALFSVKSRWVRASRSRGR